MERRNQRGNPNSRYSGFTLGAQKWGGHSTLLNGLGDLALAWNLDTSEWAQRLGFGLDTSEWARRLGFGFGLDTSKWAQRLGFGFGFGFGFAQHSC